MISKKIHSLFLAFLLTSINVTMGMELTQYTPRFDTFPQEIMGEIASYLHLTDINALAQTAKNERMWKVWITPTDKTFAINMPAIMQLPNFHNNLTQQDFVNIILHHKHSNAALIQDLIQNASNQNILLMKDLLVCCGYNNQTPLIDDQENKIFPTKDDIYDVVSAAKGIKPNNTFIDHKNIFLALENKNNDNIAPIIKILLSNNDYCKIDCNATQSFLQQTALHIAARLGNTEVIKLLIKNYCNLDAKNKCQETALLIAIWYRHTKAVKFLIENNCDLNAKNKGDKTALHIAAQKGQTAVVKLLIGKKGCNLDAKNKRQETALHIAAQLGHTKVVKLLIENHCNLNTKNKREETALHMAICCGNTEAAKLLIESNCDLNAQNECQETALHIATRCGQTEVVKLLIENHCNLDAKNAQQKTALDVAQYFGQTEVIKLLIKDDQTTIINTTFP